jgi:hypothetical protein
MTGVTAVLIYNDADFAGFQITAAFKWNYGIDVANLK